jgi:hypothetical protein
VRLQLHLCTCLPAAAAALSPPRTVAVAADALPTRERPTRVTRSSTRWWPGGHRGTAARNPPQHWRGAEELPPPTDRLVSHDRGSKPRSSISRLHYVSELRLIQFPPRPELTVRKLHYIQTRIWIEMMDRGQLVQFTRDPAPEPPHGGSIPLVRYVRVRLCALRVRIEQFRLTGVQRRPYQRIQSWEHTEEREQTKSSQGSSAISRNSAPSVIDSVAVTCPFDPA